MNPDAAQLLAELVAFPTVAGTPNGDLVAFAAERLEAAGAEVAISPGAREDAQNVHAVFGPPDVPGLMLSAHTDVVSVQGQTWSSDPFVLREQDGRLYGRGTADMKGFIAAVLAAVGDGEASRQVRRPVHVLLSSDEELGCRGIRPLLAALEGTIAPPYLTVVGEPTGLRVVDRHKGKLALRARVRGRSAHSSRPADGVNAVEYAARLIVSLLEIGQAMRDGQHDDRFPVPHATLSVGPIRGGVSLNVVPDTCEFEVEARHLPDQDARGLAERVVGLAEELTREMCRHDPSAGVTVEPVVAYPGLGGEAGDGALVQEVCRLTGCWAVAGGVDYGTEAGLLAQAFGGTVVVCGPGEMAQAHRPDEYLVHTQLDDAVTFVQRLARTRGPLPPKGSP